MTKLHFIALADTLKELCPERGTGASAQWERTVDKLADFCKAQNSRFDRERWIDYINGDNGPNGGRI